MLGLSILSAWFFIFVSVVPGGVFCFFFYDPLSGGDVFRNFRELKRLFDQKVFRFAYVPCRFCVHMYFSFVGFVMFCLCIRGSNTLSPLFENLFKSSPAPFEIHLGPGAATLVQGAERYKLLQGNIVGFQESRYIYSTYKSPPFFFFYICSSKPNCFVFFFFVFLYFSFVLWAIQVWVVALQSDHIYRQERQRSVSSLASLADPFAGPVFE